MHVFTFVHVSMSEHKNVCEVSCMSVEALVLIGNGVIDRNSSLQKVCVSHCTINLEKGLNLSAFSSTKEK